MLRKAIMTLVAGVTALAAFAQNPKFHIYLCIGQSNMEGSAQIEPVDRTNVPERFRMMAAVDYTNPQRTKGEWYTAVPPLVRQGTGLTPVDWFGRTMLDNMPKDEQLGVVMVAIGGCKIEHLDKDYDPSTVVKEADWFRGFMSAYDNRPYDRLIECAKKAQRDGVIKGILLHQGCSNTGDRQWYVKVKKVYEDILKDLGLKAKDVPLIAGEVVTTEMGGVCGSMNPIIDRLPETIPTASVVSSKNLEQKGDGLHFTPHAYRVLGCRYAVAMLDRMGVKNPIVKYSEEKPFVPEPKPGKGDLVLDFSKFNPSIWESGTFDAATKTFTAGKYGFGGWEFAKPVDLSGYKYIVAELQEPQEAGAMLRIFDTEDYWAQPYSREFGSDKLIVAELDGMMKPVVENGKQTGIATLNTARIHRIGFWSQGGKPVKIKQVFVTNTDPYSVGR